MQEILGKRNSIVLEQLAWSNVLLAFDFDGTLSPIVAERSAASMRPSTQLLAADLAALYPCAIVSGRSYDDLTRLTGELVSWTLWSAGDAFAAGRHDPIRAEVKRWAAMLTPSFGPSTGIEIEDKGTRLSLHYRRSRARRSAAERIEEALRSVRGARVIHGKQVVHLLPVGAPHKGIALEELRVQAECDTALYVGDDETDEDVFACDRPGRLTTIRVGKSPRSQAQYFLQDQSEVDVLMERLIEIRKRRGRRREVA